MKWLDRFAERLLLSPILWGGLLSFGFHFLADRVPVKLPPWLMQRLTGQWESYVCTTLFFMAVAFGIIRCIGLVIQFRVWQRFENDSLPAEGQQPFTLQKQLETLESDAWAKKSSLCRRLQDAREFCLRQNTASSLTTYLKERSDAEFDRLHAQYGLMRMLIWAIPSCGSVATILAIAQVVEKMPTDNSTDVLAGAAAGLSGAFNLFAFSVGLAIVLVGLKFAIEQAEQLLLAVTDKQVSQAMSAEISDKIVPAVSPADQFQQLTEVLKSVANSLTQQAQNVSRSPSPATAAAAPMKDIESAVQSAIASAFQRQPAMAAAGEPAGIDAAGWKGLQHVLQKLAHVLELQNAKLESEGRVTKQLTTIIDEGLKDMHPPLRIHDGRQVAAAARF